MQAAESVVTNMGTEMITIGFATNGTAIVTTRCSNLHVSSRVIFWVAYNVLQWVAYNK